MNDEGLASARKRISKRLRAIKRGFMMNSVAKLAFYAVVVFVVLALSINWTLAQPIFSDRFESGAEGSLPAPSATTFTANLDGARVLQAMDGGITGSTQPNGVLAYRSVGERPPMMQRMFSRTQAEQPASNLIAVLENGQTRLALDSDLAINVQFTAMAPDGREVYVALSDQVPPTDQSDNPPDYQQLIARENCAIFAIAIETNDIRCVASGLMVQAPPQDAFNPRNDKAILFDRPSDTEIWEGSVVFRARSFDRICDDSNNCSIQNRANREQVYQVPWDGEARAITTDLDFAKSIQLVGDSILLHSNTLGTDEVLIRYPSGSTTMVHRGRVSGLVADDFGTLAYSTENNGLGLAMPLANGTFESTLLRVGEENHQNAPGQLIVADDGVLYGFRNGELRRLLPHSKAVVARVELAEAQDWSQWWNSMWRTPMQIARGYALHVETVVFPGRGSADVIRKTNLQTGEVVTILGDNPEQFRIVINNWRLSGSTLYFSGRNLANSDTVLGELDVLAIRNGETVSEALTLRPVASALGAALQVRDVEVVGPAVPVFDTGMAPTVRPSADVLDGRSVTLEFTKFMRRQSVLDRLTLRDASGNEIRYIPFWLLRNLHLVPDPSGLDGTASGSLEKDAQYELEFAAPIRDLWDWDLNLRDSAGLTPAGNQSANFVYRFSTSGLANAVLGNVVLGQSWRQAPPFSYTNLINLSGLDANQTTQVPAFNLDTQTSVNNFEWIFGYDNHDFDERGSIVLTGENGQHIGIRLKRDHIQLSYFSQTGERKLATARVRPSEDWNDRRGWHRMRVRLVNGQLTLDYAYNNGSLAPVQFFAGSGATTTLTDVSLALSSIATRVSVTAQNWCPSPCTVILSSLKVSKLDEDGSSVAGGVMFDLDAIQPAGGALVQQLPGSGFRLSDTIAATLDRSWMRVGQISRLDMHGVTTPQSITRALQIRHDNRPCVPYELVVPGFESLVSESGIDDFTASFWVRLQPNSGFSIGSPDQDIIRVEQTHQHMDFSFLQSLPGSLATLRSTDADARLMDWYEVTIEKVGAILNFSIKLRGAPSNLSFESSTQGLSVPVELGEWEAPRLFLTGNHCANPAISEVLITNTTSGQNTVVYDVANLSLDSIGWADTPAVSRLAPGTTLSVEVTGEGAVSPANVPIQLGERIQLTLQPDPGYSVAEVSGCDGILGNRITTVGADNSRVFETAPITRNCSIEVSFKPTMILAENEVTVTCPYARPGDSGEIGGKMYTRRENHQINQDNALAESACTTHIDRMNYMLRHDFNGDIRSWDTSAVTTMEGLFQGASSFNQDISKWDTSNVVNMRQVFNGASQFNADISEWDVSQVTDMHFMFHNASAFNRDIGDWDTSRVTDMEHMFDNAQVFNQNIHQWDVSNVQTMKGMFANARNFNQPLSGWDTGAVTNMREMFRGASEFNQDISPWNTSAVTTMRAMFEGASVFNQPINTSEDGGYWNVGQVTDMFRMFNQAGAFNQNLNRWNTASVVSMSGMFTNVQGFTGDITTWDTSSVTSMDNMFAWADQFNGDISGWNTSSVVNMGNMFDHANSFNRDISEWDVSNVTNMREMFRHASRFNQDLAWDTSSVEVMSNMFERAWDFNGDVSGWDTSSVTFMTAMFDTAQLFNRDLSGWCVVQITAKPTDFDRFTAPADNGSWEGGDATRPQWGQPCTTGDTGDDD